jgi:hypothetical protein
MSWSFQAAKAERNSGNKAVGGLSTTTLSQGSFEDWLPDHFWLEHPCAISVNNYPLITGAFPCVFLMFLLLCLKFWVPAHHVVPCGATVISGYPQDGSTWPFWKNGQGNHPQMAKKIRLDGWWLVKYEKKTRYTIRLFNVAMENHHFG